MNILDIFATGSGLIGAPLRRMRDEQMRREIDNTQSEFMQNAFKTEQKPSFIPQEYKQTAPIDPQIEQMPPYQRNAVVDSYTDAGKKAGFLEYKPSQPEQPAQPSLQQPPGSDWINQAVAGLVKKGVPFQQAYQLASQMHQQKTAEYTQQRNNQEFPKLREGLANAIRSDDRASGTSFILQLQQIGVKVPTALIQWAMPNYQRVTNDIGDREVNSSFDPRTGQYTVGQAFTKGRSPDAAARLALDYSKFSYKQNRDLLGDQGKTWESRRGNKDVNDDEVDPVKQAKNLKDYSNFTREIWEKRLVDPETNKPFDGSKTAKEVADLLNNNNIMSQWKARAAAAHGSRAKAQYQNDVSALADAYGLIYENGAWRVRE